VLVIPLVLAISSLLHIQNPAPPRPALTLHIESAFDINGSDAMPVFVLYNNGVAIYRTKVPNGRYPRFAVVKLKPQVIAQIQKLATSEVFLALDSAYDLAPEWTDQSFNVIRVWSDEHTKVTKVRGYVPNAPEPFSTLFKLLVLFDAPGARPWLPDSVRVTLVRVDDLCAKSAPIAWPRDLQLPTTSMEPRVVRYKVPIRDLGRVQRLRKQYGGWDCTPVRIGRTYWGIWYDYPFLGDSAWISG
jgi:hypothetical protein